MASALLRCNSSFLHPQLSSNTKILPRAHKIKAHKIKIPKKSLRSPIITCEATSFSSTLLPALERDPNEDIKLPEGRFHRVLLWSVACMDLENAYLYCEHLTSQDFYVPPEVYDMMIYRLGEEKEFELMRETLNMMKAKIGKITEHTYLNMIRAYGMAMMVTEAVGVLNEMEEMGIKPSTKCYNSMVGFALMEKKFELVEEMFSRMRERRVRPNVLTCTLVIEARCKNDQLDFAMALFKEMPELGLTPDRAIYGILISNFIMEGSYRREGWDLYMELVSKPWEMNPLDKDPFE